MTKIENWAGKREFPIAGRYLEIINCLVALRVPTFDKNGKVLDDNQNVGVGHFIDRRGDHEPFVRVEIDTASADTVEFIITDALSGNRAAPANVTDRPSRELGKVSLARLIALALPGNVAVHPADTAVVAASATREVCAFRSHPSNTGTIWMGPTGVGSATAVVELSPGDPFDARDIGAGAAAWFARSDVSSQVLCVMTGD
jgi:hypothetical protein